MKIFSSEQIRQWDQYTIANEPVSSIQLMERAAGRCSEWILRHFEPGIEFLVFCGKGNNGGDGLAIARMLLKGERRVNVYVLDDMTNGSPDFRANLQQLKALNKEIVSIGSQKDIPEIGENQVLIEALFGSGLNRPLENIAAILVEYLNESGASIISIDIPSGLFADKSSHDFPVIRASYTLTFQTQKLAFLLAENAAYTGEVAVVDIGLHPDYEKNTTSRFSLVEKEDVRLIIKPRKKFTHKGSYGHAAVFAGSHGMMGAAVLAVKACLRSGAGKVTAAIPYCGMDIMQISVPEAICLPDEGKDYFQKLPDTSQFDAIGIGPGIGMHPDTLEWFEQIISSQTKPLVLDADALNMMASRPTLLQKIPAGTILTPHPKEFERLFGNADNDFERIELAMQKAAQLSVYIVLKGYRSYIASPDGKGFFNSTGNPGMATAGSGDVLTGLLTGILAQGHFPLDACMAAVFLHGLAGDIAAAENSEPAILAGDIVESIGKAYLEIGG